MRRLRILGVVLVGACLMGAAGEGGGMSLDSVPGGVSVVLLLEVLYRQRLDRQRTEQRLDAIERHLGIHAPATAPN